MNENYGIAVEPACLKPYQTPTLKLFCENN